MSISESPNFKSASQEEYVPIKQFTLSEGEGTKKIYVKFYTAWGQPSKAISQSIVYRKSPIAFPSSNPPINSNPSNASNFIFSRNLRLGSKGKDVKELQKFLNSKGFIISSSGPGSPNNETEFFVIKRF